MNVSQSLFGRFRPKVEGFAWWEMAIMRAAFAWLVYQHLQSAVPVHTQPHPNGAAHWVDLTFLARPHLFPALRWAAIPCLFAFVAGFGSILSLGYLFLLDVGIGTLLNSQGAIGHFSQLQTLVVGALWVAVFWDQIGRWRDGKGLAFWDSLDRQRFMIHTCRVLIAGAYLTMACSKLERSRGLWFWEAPNLSVQLVKVQNNLAADTGSPVDPFLGRKLPELILAHPALARTLLSPGLWLEFFVFLGLMGRGWSLVIGSSVIVMHEAISRLMALYFFDHQVLMAVFFVNLPFWLVTTFSLALKRFRRANPMPADPQTVEEGSR